VTHHRQDESKDLWTDEAILRESGRWVHVPPSGVRVEDAARLLVHPRARRGTSRVWRSRPDRAGAEALILQTIEETRAAGGTGLVWHTGDAVSPPFMDDALTQQGFEKTEDLEVLAFELGTGQEPNLPDLRVPHDVSTRLVRDRDDLRLANVVEAGVFPASTWGEADTRAYLHGLSELDARRQGRPGAEGVACALRYLALVRSRRGGGQEIAGTAGAELAGETVRLWGAGTLPGHRRRGAYRALVMERCRHAHALGATLALTKANTASSAPILREAGFRPVSSERRYALEISA
jgi:GNAT superfamily N-acetyltransferase